MGQAASATQTLSVVVPVYGCVACLASLCDRLREAIAPLVPCYEVVLVDDRSPDDAWLEILRLQERHPEVKGVRLSRNFGQHMAICAGLAEARGDLVVVMDCDLQDPPERIPEMLSKLSGGYDLILARRAQRSHSAFRVLAARMYFRMLGSLTEESIDGSYGAFSLLTRKVVDAFLRFNEREMHYLFVLRWVGFKVGTIEYAHQERAAGRSAYSLRHLLNHAINGVLFQATVFLRWIMVTGLLFGLLGMGLAAFFVYRYFTAGSVPGWTSVVVLMLVCTGAILVSVGVIGLYVGKIFDQAKGRPLYLVDAVSDRPAQW